MVAGEKTAGKIFRRWRLHMGIQDKDLGIDGKIFAIEDFPALTSTTPYLPKGIARPR